MWPACGTAATTCWPKPKQPVSNRSMRTAVLALGSVAAGVLATWAVMQWRVDLPPVGPNVEQTCAEAMRAIGPDHSWFAPGHHATVDTGSIPTVGFGELSAHGGWGDAALPACCTPSPTE